MGWPDEDVIVLRPRDRLRWMFRRAIRQQLSNPFQVVARGGLYKQELLFQWLTGVPLELHFGLLS